MTPNQLIETKSPTRIDLAGGTLDCWPLYCFAGPSVTTNISIGVFSKVQLKTRPDSNVKIFLKDLDVRAEFASCAELLKSDDPNLRMIRVLMEYFLPRHGFELVTESDSPVGGGLGGSSSLCVSLIRAFDKLEEQTRDVYATVKLASDLEARILNKLTGTQDYYPAASPGVCAIHYEYGNVKLEKVKIPTDVIESRLSVVYTGKSHNSGINNWQVIKLAVEGHAQTLEALRELQKISHDVYRAVKLEKWEELADCFGRETQARMKLAKGFSSPEIEKLAEVAKSSGAWATKICGAGGGGCVFIWSPEKNRQAVEARVRDEGFRILQAPVVQGAH